LIPWAASTAPPIHFFQKNPADHQNINRKPIPSGHAFKRKKILLGYYTNCRRHHKKTTPLISIQVSKYYQALADVQIFVSKETILKACKIRVFAPPNIFYDHNLVAPVDAAQFQIILIVGKPAAVFQTAAADFGLRRGFSDTNSNPNPCD